MAREVPKTGEDPLNGLLSPLVYFFSFFFLIS